MRPALALRGTTDHITETRSGRIAWYLAGSTRWSFRSEEECEGVIKAGAMRYAEAIGRTVHWRVTEQPVAVSEWGRQLDENSPNALPGWGPMLRDVQRHMRQLQLGDKLPYFGVDLQTPKGKRHREATETELAELESLIAGAGLDARPVTPAELEWLIHRSVSLGLPAPVTMPPAQRVLAETDLPEITDSVEWTAEPYGRSVRVAADVNGTEVVRHVVILTVGRMATLHIPEQMEPWLQRVDRLPFPVEICATIEIKTTDEVKKGFTDALNRIRSQVAHWREHELDPPIGLQRQRKQALKAEDQVTSQFDGLATRTWGWYRFAVSGETEREALDRAQQLIRLYGSAITVVRPAAQLDTAREFIPGESLSSRAYRRDMPVTNLAAAVPSATSMVGDGRGPYMGTTCGTSARPVCDDPWEAMEVRERSGLTLIAGGLGAGKSVLMADKIYQNVMRGIPFTVWDPAGPLSRLCEMAELVDHSRHIDLLNAAPGSLSPYRVVEDPRRDHYATDAAYVRALALVEARRRQLCYDVLSVLLPPAIMDNAKFVRALRKAVRLTGGKRGASARNVIDRLRELDDPLTDAGIELAEELAEVAEQPAAQLIFPAGYQLDYGASPAPLLTVMTMQGLATPAPGSDRRDWTTEERFGIAQLTLAATLTSAAVYGADPHARKGVAIDEAHALVLTPSGRLLLGQLSRNSRKHNACVLIASQNIGDVLTANVGNFVGSVWGGRTVDPKAQAELLTVLGIQRKVGYEGVLAGLSPQDRRSRERSGFREFVYWDGMGGCEKVRVDLGPFPELAERMDTTADPSKVRGLRVVA